MPTRNISLTDHLDGFVEAQVRSGRYGSASELIREAIRRVERDEAEYDAKIAALNAAVDEGLADVAAGRVYQVEDLDGFFESIAAELGGRHDEAPAGE